MKPGLRTKIIILVACIFSSVQKGTSQEIKSTIHIDASKVENRITPYLYGSCIEDVNHEIYGGLYDQKIFGESFEEPVPAPLFHGFTVYGGAWSARNGVVAASPYPGARLVYDPVEFEQGSIETRLQFNNGDNAGILLHVTRQGNGADNFYGYEISLATNKQGQKIIIGKHKHNFEHIMDVPVKCDTKSWNKLKAVAHNGKIEVFLNDKSACIFDDNDTALLNGKAGLRVWNAGARFRHVKIRTGRSTITPVFKTTPPQQVSLQWNAVKTGAVKAAFGLDTNNAFNGNNAQAITFISGNGTAGISNQSLNRWGISLSKGQRLQGRLYLESKDLKGPVTVALQSADGKITYAETRINHITAQWRQYPFELTSNADDKNARFAVYISQPGKLRVDQVTLMTTGAKQFKSLPYRNDIAQAMVSEGLTFLRYGGTMVNAPGYRFKKMIGDPDKRPPYRGHWYPYSTNGFGIEDFLKFCEAAGFTPAFAINIEETPEDMADMIAYLNGPVTSEWGGKRAENGHPSPYHIKYIGIGNEEVLFNGDNAAEYDHYIERFNLLYDAMKSKDPSVSLVSTAWWRPDSPNMERVFKALDGKADYWDYHPWADQLTSGQEVSNELHKMRGLFLKWNPHTNMKCAIFEENGNTHNIQRALGHVTVQNAVRRMGNFVLTSCPANALQPYQQNDNGWDQGQIFFTPRRYGKCLPIMPTGWLLKTTSPCLFTALRMVNWM